MTSITTVGSKKLKHGCRMIYAGCPSFFGLGWEDGDVPTSWLLQYNQIALLMAPEVVHMQSFKGMLLTLNDPLPAELTSNPRLQSPTLARNPEVSFWGPNRPRKHKDLTFPPILGLGTRKEDPCAYVICWNPGFEPSLLVAFNTSRPQWSRFDSCCCPPKSILWSPSMGH